GAGGEGKEKRAGASNGTEGRAHEQQPVGDSGGGGGDGGGGDGGDGGGVVGDRSRGLTGAPAHHEEGKMGGVNLPTPLLSPSRGAGTRGSRVRRDGGTSVEAATASVDGENGKRLGGKVEGGKGKDGKGRGGGAGAWEPDAMIPRKASRDLLPRPPPRLAGDNGPRTTHHRARIG
ncbi:unnamed protein product, partial [Laminaria digitata]